MSAYAKSVVGAIAAVLITGITAWQAATAGGFHLIALLPVATAITGAALTYVAPNVPESPALKGIVSAVLAVLTALSTAITGQSQKADAITIVFAALGALATWYVPNYPAQRLATDPAHPVLEHDGGAHEAPAPSPADEDIVSALAQVPAVDWATVTGDADPPAMPTATDSTAPLPIEAEAQQAAAAQTAATVEPTTVTPAAEPPRPVVV